MLPRPVPSSLKHSCHTLIILLCLLLCAQKTSVVLAQEAPDFPTLYGGTRKIQTKNEISRNNAFFSDTKQDVIMQVFVDPAELLDSEQNRQTLVDSLALWYSEKLFNHRLEFDLSPESWTKPDNQKRGFGIPALDSPETRLLISFRTTVDGRFITGLAHCCEGVDKAVLKPEPAPAHTQTFPYCSSKTAKKFHSMSCHWAARLGRTKVEYRTREEALADGKEPCSVCNP